MPINRSAELKAKIAADVATRDKVKVPKLMSLSVRRNWTCYLGEATLDGFRALEGPDGVFPTWLQLVPRKDLSKVFMLSCDKDDAGAEKVTRHSNGTATCYFHAALVDFQLSHIKGKKMVFNVIAEPDSEYGPALVVPIGSLEYETVKVVEKKEQPKEADKSGAAEQPKS